MIDRSGRERVGFTLVELLVVIGIIALLVGVLLPALNKARAAAQTVQCASNLRQWGIGLQMYVDQNQGLLPFKGCKGDDQAGDLIGPANGAPLGVAEPSIWYNALPPLTGTKGYFQLMLDAQNLHIPLPALGSNSLYICPSATAAGSNDTAASASGYDTIAPDGAGFYYWMQDAGAGPTTPATQELKAAGGSPTTVFPAEMIICYGFNSQLLSAANQTFSKTQPIKMSQLRPGQVIPILMDRIMAPGEDAIKTVQQEAAGNSLIQKYVAIGPQGTTTTFPISQTLTDVKRLSTRHNGGSNILFCDGHVDLMSWVEAMGPNVGAADWDINIPSKLIWSPFGPDPY
jgi:prepilin-type processing-associated H-X9-DG protein